MGVEQRRGFTLVELMVALVLLVIVGGGMYSLLVTMQRVNRRQTEISGMQGTLRTGLQLVQSELQEVATNSPAGSSDILSMSATSITYRAMRGMGETCSVTTTAVKIRQSSYSGLRTPTSPREGLLLFVDGDTAKAADDRWFRTDSPTITSSTCPDGSPAWSFSVTLTAPAVADSITVPGPVRTFEQMQLGVISDGGQNWLGIRSISAGDAALLPVVGPVTSNGVGFGYFDGNVSATGTPASVKTIVITLRGITQKLANTGTAGALTILRDSLTVRVQLRNSL